MTTFDDRIDEHRFAKSVETATAAAETVESEEPDLETVRRLAHVLRLLRAWFTSADRSLLAPAMLEPAAEVLAALENQLGNFRSNHDIAHLDAANTHLDELLTHVARWPISLRPADIAETVIEDAERAAQRAIATANDLVEQARTQAEAKAAELETRAAQSQAIAANLDTRLDELIASIEAQKSRLDVAIADSRVSSPRRRKKDVANLTRPPRRLPPPCKSSWTQRRLTQRLHVGS